MSLQRLLLLRWAWALLAALAVRSDDVLYKKVGDSVVLLPRSLPSPVNSITWMDGTNIGVQWESTDPDHTDYFRQYEGLSDLNATTAALTITQLTTQHNGNHSVFVNEDIYCGSVMLVVIAAVPVPSISHVCHNESCVLTCEGDTSEANPVTYTWRSGETELPNETNMKLHITKETSFPFFTCDLKNPVSLEGSPRLDNPLVKSSGGDGDHGDGDHDGPKISVGLTVFISLLACLLMLVLFHRWKAGMWFFEKESFPWTADFWRREEGEVQRVAQSDEASPTEEEAVELNQPKL